MRYALVLLSIVGCSDSPPPTAPETPPTSSAPALAESSTFTVHEWGFIGHHFASGRDGSLSLATGRARRASPRTPAASAVPPRTRVHGDEGRPVIYFHFDEPARPMEIRVTFDVGEGTMVEHLPTAHNEGSQYRWDLIASHARCPPGSDGYPAGGRSTCGGRPDGYCEASFLRAYETDDAACLEVDGRSWKQLFYRSQVRVALPIEVSQGEDGFVVHAHAALPGRLMHIRRGERLDDTRVHVFDAPASGEQLVLPTETAGTPIEGQRFLEAELRARGMTEAESRAFMRGWVVDLLGSNTGVGERVQDMRAPDNLAAKRDALVYFMPEAAVQAMAPLQFEPPAREVRRAILVRVDLGDAPEPRAVPAAIGGTQGVTFLYPSIEGSWRHRERALSAARESVASCYRRALEVDGDATGLAELHFDVSTEGTMSDVEVRWRAGGNAALAACLVDAVGEPAAPPPARPAHLILPVLFEPR
ncbi:MAG: hypothetical protein AB8H86_32580 [Polyangiales bacterium]